ncbi:MAG TPA: DNA cytosine methyltransferase [Thermoanaerobaculia bacterium]|nr:DNA cytosine methyltransferase [Thermoanaerobaculia bacterium]
MTAVRAVDLFCGAGGTSLGLARACQALGRPVDLVAINHWPRAVETHRLNHPWARHHCARVESFDPRQAVPGGEVDLIVAGVECTHHSRARGGRPMSDQSRASAWAVIHWAEALRVRDILVENVTEFTQWGPLDEDGKPIRERRGDTFRAFVRALESLTYRVEWRILNCADYGDPTTRRRLFLRARLGKGPIDWPQPSHAPEAEGGLRPWRTAREIIDWSDLGDSIFARRKPLAKRTLARIEVGIRRFCGANAEAFLVMLYGSNTVRSLDVPLPVVTAQGQHIALATPFVLPTDGPQRPREQQAPRSVDRPLNTVRASRGGGHLVTAFILPHDQFVARNGLRLVDGIDRPLRTIRAGNGGACNYLVTPFIVPLFGERPGQTPRVHSVEGPVPTVTATKGAGCLVTPFLVPYYGTGQPRPIEEPLGTVTTRDRFALVTPDGFAMDILFRMLKPSELAQAQGFHPGYRFTGNKGEVVRQIGNAVPVHTAELLCRSILSAPGDR